MATALRQCDTDTPFSDCSITSLLPRTLGSSISARAATLESDDLNYVSSLFNSTALNNSTQLLEHAKAICNSNCSNILNARFEDKTNILAKRSHECQIELTGKRPRQRRPGLSGVERVEHVFNFSAMTTAVEVSQMGTSDDFSKRSCRVESNSQSWPVIDYSCLEHISDPKEYYSTYRILENVEKEVKKLKGEASPKLSQPQRRRDRQRRPGLPELEGKKNAFKFPGMTGTVEDSQIKNSSQSNGASSTELTIASCSKEISQMKNSQTVEPETKLSGNAETYLDLDKDIDELDRLFSNFRELDNDGRANLVRETLQINPIHVENSRSYLFSVPTENMFERPQLSKISPVANRIKMDGLSNSKGHSSLIIRQGSPFFPLKSDRDKQSDGSAELSSNCKVICDDGLEKLPCSETKIQTEYLEKLMSACNNISVDGIAALEQETLNTRPPNADEMTNRADHLSSLKLMDIHGRLAEISPLKRHIMPNTTEGELLMFSHDDLEDSSVSKSQEMHSLLPIDAIHLDGSSMDAQNACIPVLSNSRRLSFEDKMHFPVAETSVEDENLGKRKISDSIGYQITLLEKTCQRAHGTISDEEFASMVSRANFGEAGQSSASVDRRSSESLASHFSDKLHQPFVNTDAPEQILHTEAPEDDSLPENRALLDEQMEASFEVLSGRNKVNTDAPEQILHTEAPVDDNLPENRALLDEQMEASFEVLSGRNKNQEHAETSGGSSNRKLEREEPPRRRRKQRSDLRRKSLAGAGSVWKSGVRRSTRIRMKPLQYWCGERFLYGRVHDSLTTVIGVKKFETPQTGKKTVMKVKSYVSDEYADLVSQAALY